MSKLTKVKIVFLPSGDDNEEEIDLTMKGSELRNYINAEYPQHTSKKGLEVFHCVFRGETLKFDSTPLNEQQFKDFDLTYVPIIYVVVRKIGSTFVSSLVAPPIEEEDDSGDGKDEVYEVEAKEGEDDSGDGEYPYNEPLEQLMAMGFTKEQSKDALDNCEGNIEQAISLLTS